MKPFLLILILIFCSCNIFEYKNLDGDYLIYKAKYDPNENFKIRKFTKNIDFIYQNFGGEDNSEDATAYSSYIYKIKNGNIINRLKYSIRAEMLNGYQLNSIQFLELKSLIYFNTKPIQLNQYNKILKVIKSDN